MTAMTTSAAEVREKAKAAIPTGRYGTAEEVGSAVGYLASDAASFVNGAIIDVTGGAFMP
jgi:3-oxoacyl-[acyl-carrier protein] reductase